MTKTTYSTKTLILRFIPYYKKYKGILFMDLFCATLTTVCELVLPLIMRYITNEGIRDLAGLSLKTIGGLSLLYLILRLIDAVANYYMGNMGHVMGAKIETDMRKDAFSHLLRLSDTFYSNTKVGQIMGRITNDLFDVTEFAHHCPEEFLIAFFKTGIAFIILLTIHVPLTLIIFMIVPVMTVVAVFLNRKMRAAFGLQRNQIGELNAQIEDSLLGQKVVKAFTSEEMEQHRFQKGNHKFLEIKTLTYRYLAAFHTTIRLFDGLMYLTVVLAGGIFMMKGYIKPGDLVAYLLYVTTLISTIRRIIEFMEQFQRGITGIERFVQIMDADVDIKEPDDAVTLVNPKGEITFERVSFEYPDDHNIVFRNLNLQIQPGEKIAIVGPSGGGKTTLCNLIPRFYDVTEGKILLDGRDIKDFTLQSLRENIGIVQQDVYLFSGTILENIQYGNPDASLEDVIKAAKEAGAHDFIQELKDGYDTYVGERGVKLSGGQKQRISIARVFLKNPPIILLDEATSALDNESEYAVAKSLGELSKGRTTLTIAHRLSSIRNSDRILVLTEEGIEEQGTHQQLMDLKGLYCQFYNRANEMK